MSVIANAPANQSIERIYQKKTQLEHILIRPDTYIGSVEKSTQEMWVASEIQEGDEIITKMVKKQITFVPGLYKIFDEILVNAADNKQRDKSMSNLKVDINVEKCRIRIYNDGKGIPVTMHKKEQVFVPTLIFGHLLTSSNFDDNQKKVTGGRNGYGAKLCNVFSTEFMVETSCKDFKKSFRQTWRSNMSSPDEPEIDAAHSKDFTRVTFIPDLQRFKMDSLDEDIVGLFKRRVYDIAASCTGVNVYLNGKKLPVNSFEDYVKLYIQDGINELTGEPLPLVHQKINDRWEIAVTSSDSGFQQMSFVNSIATTKGGKHVDYITDQIVNKLQESVKRKNKTGAEIKSHQLKSHLWVFINCLVENPSFDSQTKEFMTLAARSFGSKCEISDDFVKKVRDRCGTVESVLRWAEFKQKALLEKKGGGSKTSKLKGIPKLDDANDAGTKNSIFCTLIVTEGDSAKTLAVSGLGVVGRDRYGIFPLRGKLLNVREANSTQIMNNSEITNLCKIIGLQYKEKYDRPESVRQLRYGKLMIMADQDQDGSHIKGLVINFIHHNWPNLIKYGFIEEFITPIVKAFKGNNERLFYSMPEFEEWQSQTEDWIRWRIKYYKGLGTSTSKEAKEYFQDMLRHRILFNYAGPRDDLALTLAFSKALIEERKDWLTRWMDERKRRRDENLSDDYLYRKDTRAINYNSFVNKELVLFSNLDNERSLPSMVDGLKPGQRKVLFTCFKRNLVKELKVAQLAGSVAELSSYHHGEQSLMSTIVNLAHDFVGSNNINLLLPIGQFGTRIMGGKDAASARYIFTALNPITRFIFTKQDDPVLNYINDDGQFVEPDWYCPIIPMVLVNGSDGIGTGWSTKVPNYNPTDIIECLKLMIEGKEPKELLPFYRNFRGTIQKIDGSKVHVNGEVSILDEQTIEISELPIGVWTQQYKDTVIEALLTGTASTASADDGKGKRARNATTTKRAKPNQPDQSKRNGASSLPASCQMISDYKEYNTDITVRFVIKVTDEQMRKIKQEGFHKVFRLQKPLSLANMVMFDASGRLRRYEKVQDILKDFFTVRLSVYEEQKKYRIGQLSAESLRLDNMARFILEKIDGTIKVENVKKKTILETLKQRNYDPDPVSAWKAKISKSKSSVIEELQREIEENDNQPEDESSKSTDYDYLLGMALWSLTMERKDDLLRQQKQKADELQAIKAKSERRLWLDDLEALEEEIIKQKTKEINALISSRSAAGATGKKAAKQKSKINPNTLPSEIGERVKPPAVSAKLGDSVDANFSPPAIALNNNDKSDTNKIGTYVVRRCKMVDALMDPTITDDIVSQFVDDTKAKKGKVGRVVVEKSGSRGKAKNGVGAGDDILPNDESKKKNSNKQITTGDDNSSNEKQTDVAKFFKRTSKKQLVDGSDEEEEPIVRQPRPARKAAKNAIYIGSDSEEMSNENSDDDISIQPSKNKVTKKPVGSKRTAAVARISSESDFSLDVPSDSDDDFEA
ncbi:hypothetical protein GJ496_000179 [Pomphorhynchus laevis]|nr:hypothetical protein GJ496_000179 [Pomphorhynchus laevis]